MIQRFLNGRRDFLGDFVECKKFQFFHFVFLSSQCSGVVPADVNDIDIGNLVFYRFIQFYRTARISPTMVVTPFLQKNPSFFIFYNYTGSNLQQWPVTNDFSQIHNIIGYISSSWLNFITFFKL